MVLLQLQSAQAEVRTHAEDLINKSSVDQLLPALASAAASEENDASCRQLAAVLVRRYVHTKLKEAGITEQQQQTLLVQIMQLIMGALSPQAELIVRKAAAEAIGEVWRQAASPVCPSLMRFAAAHASPELLAPLHMDLVEELLLLLADAAAAAPLVLEDAVAWEEQEREEETPEETTQSLISACLSAVKSGEAKHDETWTNDIRQRYGQELLILLSQASSGDQSIRCRRQALLALAAFLSGMAPDEGCDPAPEALALAAVEFGADLGSAVGSEVFKADAPWLVDRVHRLLLFCEEVPAASSVFSAAMICLGVAAPASGPALLQPIQPLMGIVLKKAQASIEFGVEEQLGPAGGSLNEVAELSEEGGFSQIRVQDKTGKQMIMSINTVSRI
ncbi:hypothetical protein Emag_003178 [Eimeria magna]